MRGQPASLRENLLGRFSSKSAHRHYIWSGAVGGGGCQDCTPNWQPNLANHVWESPTWYLSGRHEGVVKSSWGLALCSKISVALKRCCQRPLVKAQPQLQWRPQHDGHARAMECSPTIVARAGWGWPSLWQKPMCALGVRTREVELHSLWVRRSWLSPKCWTLSYVQLLDFGFALTSL